MPLCDKCSKAVGSAKFCQACGTPTLLGRLAMIEEMRFQSLGDAITESYTNEPQRAGWRIELFSGNLRWLLLAGVLIVAIVAGSALATAWFHRRIHPPAATRAHHKQAAQRKASVSPVLTKAPADPPSPAPTMTIAPTIAPTVTPTASAVPSPPPTIHNASSIVRATPELSVGNAGSCGGHDVTVNVSGYPRGCTVFDAVSSGRLKNGRGTVLVVPVSTSEDVSDAAYGLLYLQSAAESAPTFLGILSGDGSGHLVVRVQSGLIMEQNGTHTQYSTYNGHRLVPVNS